MRVEIRNIIKRSRRSIKGILYIPGIADRPLDAQCPAARPHGTHQRGFPVPPRCRRRLPQAVALPTIHRSVLRPAPPPGTTTTARCCWPTLASSITSWGISRTTDRPPLRMLSRSSRTSWASIRSGSLSCKGRDLRGPAPRGVRVRAIAPYAIGRPPYSPPSPLRLAAHRAPIPPPPSPRRRSAWPCSRGHHATPTRPSPTR
jgi:hypothetical protein